LITVEMGRVSFTSTKIPHVGPEREVINEKLTVLDREFTYCSATIGNPHCVLPLADPGELSPDLAHRYGPHLETHPNFPRKTNVQFLRVLDRANIRIEIWERGAGYTLASGSSSSAAAAVAHRLGLVGNEVTVHMPGGQIGIKIAPDFAIRMTGTVNRVAEGVMHPELFKVRV
jgi:diaminopimelate epimerase